MSFWDEPKWKHRSHRPTEEKRRGSNSWSRAGLAVNVEAEPRVCPAPKIVAPALVETEPVWIKSTPASISLRPGQNDEVVCRLSMVEEVVLRIEEAIVSSERRQEEVDERVEAQLRGLEERLAEVVETFGSRDRESEDTLLVGKENVEVWKLLAATVVKSVKQVVVDATAAQRKEIDQNGESGKRLLVGSTTERRKELVPTKLMAAEHVKVGDPAVLLGVPRRQRQGPVQSVADLAPIGEFKNNESPAVVGTPVYQKPSFLHTSQSMFTDCDTLQIPYIPTYPPYILALFVIILAACCVSTGAPFYRWQPAT